MNSITRILKRWFQKHGIQGRRPQKPWATLTFERLEDRWLPSTLVVTNTDDNLGIDPDPGSGTGTLRQAIIDANAGLGTDISFNIPGSNVQTIGLLAPMPAITSSVTINGYTQPGASVNTLATGDNAVLMIVLDGTNAAGGDPDGLTVSASNVTIEGLVINNFDGDGILINSGNSNTVSGNFIGTDATGTVAKPNTHAGVEFQLTSDAMGNTIGGSSAADRNIISGNGTDGVLMNGPGMISGNYIGTTADGTAAVANNVGILISSGITNVTADSNVISGNSDRGVYIYGSSNTFTRNYIGTTADGTTALSNGAIGMEISSEWHCRESCQVLKSYFISS
jgi:hypothetical protein